MQVNLKQHEIEAALKGFISQQGISLVGKEVSISFTAGRKESGISAEMSIEDLDIPGFSTAEVHPPVLAVVPSGPINRGADEEVKVFTITEESVTKADELIAVVEEAQAEAVKTTSLFG